jgi:hypothetical protein
MSTVQIRGWSQSHATGAVVVTSTLTRFTDPANNSDKYRRFIVLSAPGEVYALFTQTGRWTPRMQRGIFDGGTYTFQKLANASQMRRCTRAVDFLDEEVKRKIGSYHIETEPTYRVAGQLEWLNACKFKGAEQQYLYGAGALNSTPQGPGAQVGTTSPNGDPTALMREERQRREEPTMPAELDTARDLTAAVEALEKLSKIKPGRELISDVATIRSAYANVLASSRLEVTRLEVELATARSRVETCLELETQLTATSTYIYSHL